MAANNQPEDADKAKANPGNVKTSLFGFYNSMSSSLKQFTVAAASKTPFRREGEKSEGGDSASSSVSGTPSHEPLSEPIQEPEIPELPPEPELPPGVLCQIEGPINFRVSEIEGPINFRILSEEYVDQAVVLLCNSFFKDEPLGKVMQNENPSLEQHWLKKALPHMIRHEVSIMALDESEEGNPKLVGVSINSVKLKGQPRGPDNFLRWIDAQKEPKINKLFSFLNQVFSDIDFYNNYGVEKLFNFELLNVDKKYGGKGIASMLVETSVNVAREKSFKCLIGLTTGIFTAKIFGRNGFKTIREVPYASQRENGKPVFPATGIHTSVRVSVKIFKDEATPKK